MFIDGSNLPKRLVQIVLEEKALLSEAHSIEDRMDTAQNLKNEDEYYNIEKDVLRVQSKMQKLFFEKAIVMTMSTKANPNFRNN